MREAREAPIASTVPPTDMLERWIFYLAVAALALAPSQLTIHEKLPLTPAELLLVFAALLWGIRWVRRRNTQELPPYQHWLVVLTACASVIALLETAQITSGGGLFGLSAAITVLKGAQANHVLKPFILDVVKTVLFLGVGYTIFRTVLTSPARIRTAVIAVLVTTTLAVTLGVVQRVILQTHYQPDPTQRTVFARAIERLSEEDTQKFIADKKDNVMGRWDTHGFHPASPAWAYLTVETPLQVSSTFGGWNDHGYLPSRMAYAGFLALILPFALVLLVRERRKVAIVAWLVLLFIGVGVSVLAGYVMPVILIGLLVTGMALGKRTIPWVVSGFAVYLGLLALIGGHNARQILYEPLQLRVSVAEMRYLEDDIQHMKKYWGEQQAALNLIRNAPLFGVGAGQYQASLGNNGAYSALGSVERQRLEPEAQSGYLLAAASTGLLGLAALLALLGYYLQAAWRAVRQQCNTHPWGAAALGALVTLILLQAVTNPWVHGTSMIIAMIFAIVGANATSGHTTRISIQEDDSCERPSLSLE